MKKIAILFILITFFVSLVSLFYSFPVNAQTITTEEPGWKGIVPCGRVIAGNGEDVPCTLCHLIVGIQRIFTYGLTIIISIAFVMIFISGVTYIVSSGDEKLMTSAKSFLKSSLIGFFIVAGAWLIVNTVLWVVSARLNNVDTSLSKWSEITCSTEQRSNSPIR